MNATAEGRQTVSAAAEPALAIDDIYPLSALQQGLLFHAKLDAVSSGAYFVQSHCMLEGYVDADAFRQAWTSIMQRHDVLRTAFSAEFEQPLQIVYSLKAAPLVIEDWRAMSERQQQDRLSTWLQNDVELGFNLEEPPLWRVALFRTSERQHWFVFSFHHLLLDGWSFSVLMQEMFDAHQAIRGGVAPQRPPARQFRDYIAWLKNQDMAAAQNYWRTRLATVRQPSLLSIGVEPNRYADAFDHSQLGTYRTALPAALSDSLKQAAKARQLTLNTLMQGAYALLLSRYCDQATVCFGIAVSTRPTELPGADRIVGLLINTLPCAVDLDDSITCVEWLQQLQLSGTQMLQHSHLALNQMQAYSVLGPGEPLFNTLYVFENHTYEVPLEEQPTADARLTVHDQNYREQTNFTLTLCVAPSDELRLQFMFDQRVLSADSVSQFTHHYIRALEQLVAHPDRPLGQLVVLSAEQQAARRQQREAIAGNTRRSGSGQQPLDDIASRTPIEAMLAKIWCEVLQRETVSVHDNFFQLGGDSIVALRIVTAAQQVGLDVSLRLLLQHRDIHSLAPHVVATAWHTQPQNAMADSADMETGVI